MLSKSLQVVLGNTGEATYVDDVFSTYLYTGNGSTQTITNGIDLAGEGGLVWTKTRSAAFWHWLTDTERGNTHNLFSNDTAAQNTVANGITSFNSNGFSVSDASNINAASQTYASWTFRKAAKFFDVVTWSGDSTNNRQISHNLGATPGCIIIKIINGNNSWIVWHNALPTQAGELNATGSFLSAYYTNLLNGAPTSTTFTVSHNGFNTTNETGYTYVAYLFAHDAGGFGADGSENVISCGSFTTDGSGNATVNLGYEPQFLITKASSTGDDWLIHDTMRGWANEGDYGRIATLKANVANAEATTVGASPSSTGFFSNGFFLTNTTYIYIAIRRPMKPPESGTEVFGLQNNPTSSSAPAWVTSFPVDFSLVGRTSTWDGYASSRLAGQAYLQTNSTAAETSSSNMTFDYSNGFGTTAFSSSGFMGYMFKRASGFMDVVCYTGNYAGNPQIPHNLGVAPEFIIAKNRGATATQWYIHHTGMASNEEIYFNANAKSLGSTWTRTSTYWQNQSAQYPTGEAHVAYLFATYPGVSKVFSYTGNGSSQTINCGFTGGARFVMIKRTDSAGDWYVWDTARGMVAGNDPHLSLNTTAAEVTTDDSVDTAASGFIVNQDAATNVNVTSATYIGLAIA